MRTIIQSESGECALACLAMISSHFGYDTTLRSIRAMFNTGTNGATLQDIMYYSTGLNLAPRPVSLEVDELAQLKLPCVLHWNLNHFVVLKKIRSSLFGVTKFIIVDPALGERSMKIADIGEHFTGVAVEFIPTDNFEKIKEIKKVPISNITGKIRGLKSALAQAIAVAFVLEIFALISPLFNQFVIDEVIVTGDKDLLKILAIGFGLMIITQSLISLGRSWFLMQWSIEIGNQISVRVFSHLTKLPVSYFAKRRLGDIVSRFGSLGTIQSTLTSLLIESLLDGLLALLALGMMLAYSIKLTLVILTGISIYLIIRWAAYKPLREASHERIVLSALENSIFLETVRSIVPIKLFGRESERAARWQNARQDVINREVKTQKLNIIFKLATTLISATQTLSIFYVGAGLVIDSILTIGMLMAFNSYSSTFSGRIFNLIDIFINVKMLTMHIDRVSDITLEPSEIVSKTGAEIVSMAPKIVFKNVSFKYGESGPMILDNISFDIKSGENLAITGASGCGKTTLCKIILGLLPATSGEILVDDIPIEQLGLQNLRQSVGTVMQDDILLSGSILDNICFFDQKYNIELAIECATLASVHDEILRMPMKYYSIISEMESGLSGGQKQRVLLARALYKRPKILCLDEATSHLDVENELVVSRAINALNITKIIVAHRPDTIAQASRVIRIVNGKIAVDPTSALSHQEVE